MLTKLTSLTLHDDPLLGSLSELQQLQHLHTLCLCESLHMPERPANYRHVQSLVLHGSQAPFFDLSCCNRLTSLEFEETTTQLQWLALPTGPDAQLQTLCIYPDDVTDNQPFSLQNLECCKQLTFLVLKGLYPDNSKDGAWPPCMPKLQQAILGGMPCALPEALLHYPQLQALSLDVYYQGGLPDWLGTMTQLKSLEIDLGHTAFPTCVLDLSQLTFLKLKSNDAPLIMTDSIMRVADWPDLEILNLGPVFNVDSRFCVVALCQELAFRGMCMNTVVVY